MALELQNLSHPHGLQATRCDEWEGRGVAGREVPPFSVKPDHPRQLTRPPELAILKHDEGWVPSEQSR